LTLKANEVLEYIRPEGGWATYGEKYEDIVFVSCEPLTKQEFDTVAKDAEKDLKAKAKAKADAKATILDRLGLTVDELKTILG
jgi:hypothetical protein